MPEPRFLVLRLGSLGDIVHTFPAVASLRETFPAAEIVWLTHPRWKVLVESCGLASEVRTIETRALSSLREAVDGVRRSRWDAAIDYQGLWKSAALPFFGGVKRRIGFSSHTIREFGVPVLYTERVKAATVHIADQNGELSRRAGSRKLTVPARLHVPAEHEVSLRARLQAAGFDRYIILSPGGGWRAKCWPAERFGVLCKKIRDSFGLRCVVNYGPGEEDLANGLRAASGDSDPLLYNDELGPLMALLRSATCIVGGDTGPLHLAIALGTPAVAIFGPTDPARNGPYRNACHSGIDLGEDTGAGDIVLRAPNSVTSHSRNNHTDRSMLAIDIESVFEAVHRRIGGSS
jgi:heptosyltransferase I